MDTKETQQVFVLKQKRRNIGLVINLFTSSSVLITLLILTIISAILFVVIREEYMLSLVDKIEKNLKSSIEKLINQAIEIVQENVDPDEIYEYIIKSLKATTITINGRPHPLTQEEMIELFEQMIPKENFKEVLEKYLNSGEIQLPEQINLDFIKNLIKKLNLDQYSEIIKIILIVTSYLTIINLLNSIIASRLLIVNGRVSNFLIIWTSILTLNLINILGLIVFKINNKKTIDS